MRMYLDSAVVIYAVEKVEPWASLVAVEISGVMTVTSELSCLECTVRPRRLGQEETLVRFDVFFTQAIADLRPVSHAVLERAAILRAKHSNLRTPDAIHLATALEAGCNVFLTNDKRIQPIPDLEIRVLTDPVDHDG